MRVVAGTWRGRVLKAPSGEATRPTTDRVKESLFAILGDRVVDAPVADLCCGAGGLGIEALSRGAARAVFVDLSQAALSAVRRNLDSLEVPADRWRIVRRDARSWLADALRRRDDSGLVLLADPPYADGLAGEMARALADDDGVVALAVLEHGSDEDPPTPDGWRSDRRRYGRTGLTILEREP